MKYIKRTLNDWLDFFHNLNIIVNNKRNIVFQTITILERLKNNELSTINDEQLIINLLTKLKIENIDIALSLLNTIKDFYRYDTLIKELNDIQKLYLLDNLAFIYNNPNLVKTYEYFTLDKYRKVFTTKSVIPKKEFDLTTNGLDNITLKANNPFIIDELDLSCPSNNERTFYTSNFRLNSILPSKEEISMFSINYERFKLFKELIKYLSNLSNIYLIIKEPNLDIKNNFKQTLRSDGLILDDENEELTPKSSYYLTTNTLKIRNANFCLITNNNISYLYVSNSFYDEVIKDLEVKNILNKFLNIEKSEENVLK